jgi:hypothetical protein
MYILVKGLRINKNGRDVSVRKSGVVRQAVRGKTIAVVTTMASSFTTTV